MAISHDAWLKALQDARAEAPATDPNALTVNELGALWNLGNSQARRIVKQLVAMGRAEVTKKPVRGADGGWRPQPAYKLKP